MEHQLNYHRRLKFPYGREARSRLVTFSAEINLEPSPHFDIPGALAGRLTYSTPQLINDLMFGDDVRVGFEGKRYKFARLEADGAFELIADGWS